MNQRFFITIFAIICAGTAMFAGTTGTLTLTGTVSGVLDITVTSTATASDLNLLVDQSDVEVATIVEKSNKVGGYTVQLESANAVAANSNVATLNGTGANTDVLEYSLSYDGNAVSFSNGVAVITDASSTTGSSGVTKSMSISYTGDDGLAEDTYSDTLTFTIAAK